MPVRSDGFPPAISRRYVCQPLATSLTRSANTRRPVTSKSSIVTLDVTGSPYRMSVVLVAGLGAFCSTLRLVGNAGVVLPPVKYTVQVVFDTGAIVCDAA